MNLPDKRKVEYRKMRSAFGTLTGSGLGFLPDELPDDLSCVFVEPFRLRQARNRSHSTALW